MKRVRCSKAGLKKEKIIGIAKKPWKNDEVV